MASSWQILKLEELALNLGGFEKLQFLSIEAAGMNPLLCHDGPPLQFQDMRAIMHCLQPSQEQENSVSATLSCWTPGSEGRFKTVCFAALGGRSCGTWNRGTTYPSHAVTWV